MAIYHPPTFINRYLQEKLASSGFGANPMYPSMPTDPNIAYGFTMDQLIGDDPTVRYDFDGSLAIYDRMLKMRRTPFPHIKSEQLLYYFYAIDETAAPKIIEITQHIQDLLDREDESAQELNSWIQAKQSSNSPLVDDTGTQFPSVFFHRIRVYQLEETRDLIDFGTARTYAGNKIIIDYDWHKS
jgi:hypothetical protein